MITEIKDYSPENPELMVVNMNASQPELGWTRSLEWEDGDSKDPMNWQPRKKWKTIASVGSMACITALGSTIIAPATPQIMLHFDSTNYNLAVLVVSINVLGYAIGPLFLSPLSEIYGRAPIYHTTNVLFVVTAVACALAPSLGTLITFRLLNGVAASVPASVGGGTIADIFAPSDRGKATSVYGLGVIVGVSSLPLRKSAQPQHSVDAPDCSFKVLTSET